MTIHLTLDTNNRPTAILNRGEVLDHFHDYMPMVGAEHQNIYIVTVLKAGGCGDVACYRAATLDLQPHTLAMVAAHGHKIREAEARKLWPDLDLYGRYRA